ncbi:MAG: alpha/beta fold hydrolase [Acutalibacteraceae bacterium]
MKKFTALLLSLILIFSVTVPVTAADTQKPFSNSEFYEVGDYTVHYRVYKPDGAVKNRIFLIHGFCLSTVSFEGLAAEYVKRGYEVILADVPNFGYSSRETSKTELISREEVMFSLMEHLGGTFIVGGHSMGGGIAINLAVDYPDTVTGLILFAPQTSVQATQFTSIFAKSGIMACMLNIVIKVALAFPPLVTGLVEMSFSDRQFAKDYDNSKITDPFKIEGTGTGIAIMMSHTRGSDLEAFSALTIPCVIVTAADDRVANADNLQAIIDNAPEGTVIKEGFDGGHMMMEYNPVLSAAETLAVIEK